MPAGFVITFLYRATGPASMGVLAYAFGTFLGETMLPIDHAPGPSLADPGLSPDLRPRRHLGHFPGECRK